MEESMRKALELIASGCERSTSGWCGDEVENWSPYAKWADDMWCAPCIAKAGLEGKLPEKGKIKCEEV